MGRKQKVTDGEILAAARAVFDELGYDASTDVVARRLGVTSPVLFKRFGSKLELFVLAMLPERLPSLGYFTSLGRLPVPHPSPLALREIVVNALQLAAEVWQVINIFLRNNVSLLQAMKPPDLLWPHFVLTNVEAWFQHAHDMGAVVCKRPDRTAEYLLSLSYAAVFQRLGLPFRADRTAELEGVAEDIASFVWRSVSPENTVIGPHWPDTAKLKIDQIEQGPMRGREHRLHAIADISAAAAELGARLRSKPPVRGAVMIDFGDQGVLLVHAANGCNQVETKRAHADCTLHMSFATFQDIETGTLMPPAAISKGLITAEGDESLAFELFVATR